MILTHTKQIPFIVILCFTFVYGENVHAMRCGIKSLMQPHTARHIIVTSFPNGDPNSPLKKLQQIYDFLENIEPTCFAAVEKTNACKYKNSCCLLAKNSTKLAKKGKAIRLKNTSTDHEAGDVDAVYIHILKDIAMRLSILQQKNTEAHNIFSASQNKETIEPFHKELCELTKNISECLTYSANIYGTTFYECSARYYEKNPCGLFFTQDMTPQECEREKLQNECNKINKELMKSNGYSLNQNILLGWGKHTMNSAYIGAWLAEMKKVIKEHDDYVKNGGGIY